MAYNDTILKNATTLEEWFKGTQDASNGLFLGLMLLALFIILFISFKNYETKVGLVASLSIVSLLATFLVIANLISLNLVLAPVAMLLGSLIWIALSDD